MAVEIKELIIRATLEDSADGKKGQAEKKEGSTPSGESEQSAIVEACVKQVLKILKQQQQR